MASITLEIFGSGDSKAGYITWTPVPLAITGISPSGTKAVTLKSRSLNGSITQLWFMAQRGDAPADEITIDLGADNQAVVYVAGKWQHGKRHFGASEHSKDVAVDARWADQTGEPDGSLDLMIRVRKNANELSEKAQKDFVDALARLNGIQIDLTPAEGPGNGVYNKDFIAMHVEEAYTVAHGDSMFLPWHRLYLLDLERLLQEVIPTVTLPYWKFDKEAPNVFTKEFLGQTKTLPPDAIPMGTTEEFVEFHSDNHLSQWKFGDRNGIPRAARFDTKTEAAKGQPGFLMITDEETMRLHGASGELGTPFPSAPGFARMEGAPHGAGHVSFNGPVYVPNTAPQDPIFFLLHCNVDRLWAVWQFTHHRDVASEEKSYPYQRPVDTEDPWKLIDAPQWPWHDSVTSGGLFPPGTRKENFTPSLTGKQFPGGVPLLLDAIDPFAYHAEENYLGFAYDDVPFDHSRASASPLA